MDIIKTNIPGLCLLSPKIFKDNRGYFYEAYNKATLEHLGLELNFVQENESCSCFGTLRGLHFQSPPFAQAKLVRVLSGKIYDIALDLRSNSPTFGQAKGIELSDSNKCQVFIPRGFAHGFSVLSESAVVEYKCDNFYNKAAEGAINLLDKELAINWRIDPKIAIISEKDRLSPSFAKYCENKIF